MNIATTTRLLCVFFALGACGPAPMTGRDGGSTPQRGGGSRMPMASQQSGATARNAQSSGMNQGSESNGVTCDGALEGAGLCVDETQLLACAGGNWYLLDCASLITDGFCGYDTSNASVDCFAAQ